MRDTSAGRTLVALQRNRVLPVRRIARIRIADLEIDALDLRLTQGSREIRLSPSEHIVLYTLAAKRGAMVSYRALAAALGNERDLRNNTLARHVATLRRKLGDDSHHARYVETVPGLGYRFVARP
jgi:DNA-binding response OmpR family regulator